MHWVSRNRSIVNGSWGYGVPEVASLGDECENKMPMERRAVFRDNASAALCAPLVRL